MPRRSLILALVFFTALVVYAGVRTAAFVYEDAGGVATYQYDNGGGPWWQRTRPLAWLTFSADAWMGHHRPVTFHATNVVLHLLNGGLVYALATAIGAGPGVALVGTYIFLVHPLQTEAVAYVSERTELLATFWLLAAALLALSRYRWRYLALTACYLLALASKESAMIGVGLILLTVGMVLPLRPSRRAIVIIGLLGTALSVAMLLKVWHDSYTPGGRSPLGWLPFWAWQATAIWRYLALVLFPLGQNVDHDFEIVPRLVQALAVLTLVPAAVALGLAWLGRRILFTDARVDVLLFGLLWATIDLAPRFAMRITEAVSEHQMYRPMVGLSIALAQGLVWLYPTLLSWTKERTAWQLESSPETP